MGIPNGVQRDDGQRVVGTTEGIDPSSPFFCLGLHWDANKQATMNKEAGQE